MFASRLALYFQLSRTNPSPKACLGLERIVPIISSNNAPHIRNFQVPPCVGPTCSSTWASFKTLRYCATERGEKPSDSTAVKIVRLGSTFRKQYSSAHFSMIFSRNPTSNSFTAFFTAFFTASPLGFTAFFTASSWVVPVFSWVVPALSGVVPVFFWVAPAFSWGVTASSSSST